MNGPSGGIRLLEHRLDSRHFPLHQRRDRLSVHAEHGRSLEELEAETYGGAVPPRQSPVNDPAHSLERARMTRPVLKVKRLRCEHCRNPLGLDASWPRPSWILEPEGQGQTQSAYQVLVAGSVENLRTGENLLWDSGTVECTRSVGIEYEGEELRSGSRCVTTGRWCARAWKTWHCSIAGS
jgi:hypothetical protein